MNYTISQQRLNEFIPEYLENWVKGNNVNMGETGFGLFDNAGKLICIISTKYTQGGYVATSSKSVK